MPAHRLLPDWFATRRRWALIILVLLPLLAAGEGPRVAAAQPPCAACLRLAAQHAAPRAAIAATTSPAPSRDADACRGDPAWSHDCQGPIRGPPMG
ncbi:MAG: hypothetical protein J0M02_16765 [Planctomycetes bacterium]|nr:hypothetical protein [Planctomycetota bacterium]